MCTCSSPSTRFGDKYVVFGMGNLLSNQSPAAGLKPQTAGRRDRVGVHVAPEGADSSPTPSRSPPPTARSGPYTVWPVTKALADPSTPAALRAQLKASLARTKAIYASLRGHAHDAVSDLSASRSALAEALERPGRGGPAVESTSTAPGRPCSRRLLVQPGQQDVAGPARALGDDLDPAVAQVGGGADEAELEPAGPCPPPEADPLDACRGPTPSGGPRGRRARTTRGAWAADGTSASRGAGHGPSSDGNQDRRSRRAAVRVGCAGSLPRAMISATRAGPTRDNRRVTPPDDDALAVHPCRAACRWVGTRAAPHELFACQGCGSQWRPGEAWTPVDLDGRVPVAVRRARRRFTSGPTSGAAGRAGSRTTNGS